MDKLSAKIVQPKNTIEETLDYLREQYLLGENVLCECNSGVYKGILYSADAITNDALYQQVFGKTKEELTKEDAEREEQISKDDELKREEAKENIPMWIEQSKGLIPEGKMERWKEIVNDSANGIYHGTEVKRILEVLQVFQSGGSYEDLKAVVNEQDLLHIQPILKEIMGQVFVHTVQEIVIGKSEQQYIDENAKTTETTEKETNLDLIQSAVEATEEKTTFGKIKEMATKVFANVKDMLKSKDEREQGEDR
jgi:hypothetical protein